MARVCVVRQHYVPRDSRVARAVATLTGLGHEVDVVCLRAPGEARRELVHGATVLRLPLRHRRGGPVGYLVEYLSFLVLTAVVIAVRHPVRRYRLVQVHTLPDALVFTAAVPRACGARVLLDLQECMPEFFAAKFGAGASHPMTRALVALERAAIRFADAVTTPTDQMRARFVERGADPSTITTVMDGADPDTFARLPAAGPADGRFVLVSHGTVEAQYGLDTVLRAVALLRDEIPSLRLEVYGDGTALPGLRALAAELGVDDRVRFSGAFVPMSELAAALARADVGVVALVRDPYRDLALAGKMFDFVATGTPMVVSRTLSVEATFGPDGAELFESGDPADLARAVRRVHASPERRRELVRRAAERAEPLAWRHQRARYERVVAGLLPGHTTTAPHSSRNERP